MDPFQTLFGRPAKPYIRVFVGEHVLVKLSGFCDVACGAVDVAACEQSRVTPRSPFLFVRCGQALQELR